jgi:hypothetical protein
VDEWLFTNVREPVVIPAAVRRHFATSAFLVATSTIIAFFVKDLNAVIDFAGALGGGATAFLFPPMAYMNCMAKPGPVNPPVSPPIPVQLDLDSLAWCEFPC